MQHDHFAPSFLSSFAHRFLMAAALSSLALSAAAQTAFFDFNTVGQYTNNFTPWNDNGSGSDGFVYSFMENPTSGVAGSGGVSVFQSSDTTAILSSQLWDFSTNGATITVSVMVKDNGQTSGNKVQLGIINMSYNGLNNNLGVAFESFRTVPSSTTVWSLREQYRTGNLNAVETVLGNINVVAGHWYKFVVGATNTSPGNFAAGCAIYDYGTDGQTPGPNIVTFNTATNHTGQDIANTSTVWPALRAWQNAGIDAWDNFLVYTTNSPPVITIGLTNVTAPAGKAVTFNALADGPGPITYSWYTNGILAGGAAAATYTSPPLNASYTTIMVVATNVNGAVSNSASISVFTASLATVTNTPASSITPTSAQVGGQVLSTGGDAPTITLFYGPFNGGNNPAAWSNNISLGVQNGMFSQTLSSLTPNTTYFFTARAVNAAGTNWASPSLSFSTPQLLLATIVNLPATNIQASSATLNGNVVSTGGDTPVVTIYYGPSNGGTNAAAWANSVVLGLQPGFFAQTITGLNSNSTYYFTAKAVNAAGTAWAKPSQSFGTPAINTPSSAVAVLTQHNDNGRTGMNLAETSLNTGNVNTNQFGLLYTRPVDDQIYVQPLVLTNVSILGKGTHNIVYLATVNDTMYAYDADDPSVTSPYWQVSFLGPNIVPVKNTDMTGACGGAYHDFSGNMGIVGTPAIDASSGTLYVVVRTKEFGTNFVQRLHALDVATGAERTNSPVVIAANNGVAFDPYKQNQRPSLLLSRGIVYISWASHCDWTPYHGWVIGYYTSNLLQAPISFNATPSGSQAGVWMSNQGPVADTNGNVYITTGNGTFDGVSNFGESFLRLSPSGANLNLTSWFTPYNWNSLNGSDNDLGSGGILLIPGTNLLLAGGKAGVLYLVNKDNMGGLSGSTTADTNIVESWSLSGHSLHGGAVWWDSSIGSYAYIWGAASDHLRQYTFTSGQFNTNTFIQSTTIGGSGQPGGILSLSANRTNAGSGIVWAAINTSANANQAVVAGTLHAYDAQNIANELWNSDMLSARDAVGNFAKFVAPTVANAKVYLPTFSNRLNVYGLLPSPQLNISRAGINAILTWTTNSYGTFSVQYSTNLAPANWQTLAVPVITNNGLNQVTVQATNGPVFYRLKR